MEIPALLSTLFTTALIFGIVLYPGSAAPEAKPVEVREADRHGL